MGKIPVGWMPYSPIGNQVPGTRFIAFKVPLRETFVDKLKPEDRFTVGILLERVPELGLIIDLTQTTKYYNKDEVLDRGVDYVKIPTPGQVVPTQQYVDRFFEVVDYFLETHKNDDSLIGVHCTHGVNRTGYMLSRYLIQRLGYSVEEAVEAVGTARGHMIERSPYLANLRENQENIQKKKSTRAELEEGSLLAKIPGRKRFNLRYLKRRTPEEVQARELKFQEKQLLKRKYERIDKGRKDGSCPAGPCKENSKQRRNRLRAESFKKRLQLLPSRAGDAPAPHSKNSNVPLYVPQHLRKKHDNLLESDNSQSKSSVPANDDNISKDASLFGNSSLELVDEKMPCNSSLDVTDSPSRGSKDPVRSHFEACNPSKRPRTEPYICAPLDPTQKSNVALYVPLHLRKRRDNSPPDLGQDTLEADQAEGTLPNSLESMCPELGTIDSTSGCGQINKR